MYKLFIMLLSLLFSPSATHTHVDSGCVCAFWWLSLQDCFFFCFYFWFFFLFFSACLWFRWTLSTCWLSIENICAFPSFSTVFSVLSIFSVEFVALLSSVFALCCCSSLLLFFIACLHSWCAWWTFPRTFASCQRQRNVSNVLQSPSEKWPHDILLSWKTLRNQVASYIYIYGVSPKKIHNF